MVSSVGCTYLLRTEQKTRIRILLLSVIVINYRDAELQTYIMLF